MKKIYFGIENLKDKSMDWSCKTAILTSKNDTAVEIDKILDYFHAGTIK